MTDSPYKLTMAQRALVDKYRDVFVNTGGHGVVELIERPGVNFQNNYVVAALQVALMSQVQLLQQLQARGLLKEV